VQDLRYALRTLRRNPGFAAAVVLTVALGIGANATIFSLFEAIMLRTLAVHAPGDLYFVAHGSDGRYGPGSNYPYFERIRSRTDVFAGTTAYLRSSFKIATGEITEIAPGQFVSGNYHAVLGVPMALGRGFASEDDRGGAASLVAVISDGYWARRFGRDPQVLNRTIAVDGRPVTIVGVTSPDFNGLEPGRRPDVTLPLAVRTLDAPGFLTMHDTWLGDMPIVARLAAGVTSAQAAPVVDAVFQQYLTEPDNRWLMKLRGWDRVRGALVPASRGTEGLRDQYSTSLQVLMAMVGVVLLLGCANVANLFVARGSSRAREVAVRMSIGAGRLRLVRQFLTESLLLAFAGGALGFLLARFAVAAIASMVEGGSNPIVLDLRPNATVLTFTAAVTALTGVLFGLLPAFAATRVDLTPALKSGTTVHRPGRRAPTRQVLVAVQIASCVLLVSAAGLLGRTLRNLETRGGGFDRSNVVLFSLDSRGTSFRAERMPALCDDLLARMIARSGAVSGSCSIAIPINSRGNARPLEVPGAAQSDADKFVFMNRVTPDYFRTLGIGVLNGRVFDSRDRETSEKVIVINRSTARFFFGDENPVGRRVHFFKDEGNPMTVVGVVDDTIQRSLREEPWRIVYMPLAQLPEPVSFLFVAVKTTRDPAALAAGVRPEVRALSPAVVVDSIRTMDQQIGAALVRERLLAMLSAAFGVLALVLSCVGLYGVVSYDVSRSLRELGIRLALGAQREDVLRHVLRGALSVSTIGVLVGLAAAVAATRLLATLLFGVTARDPITLISAAVLLVLTILAASYFPARRASRLDPVEVLRIE
jgi:putative ABC transport system permease protein